MIGVALTYLLVSGAFCFFGLVLLAVCAPVIRRRAFDDGWHAGRDAERLRPTPGNVRRLPVQR